MTAPAAAAYKHLTCIAGQYCCARCLAPLFNGLIVHRDGCQLKERDT